MTLTPKGYLPRLVDKKVEDYLKTFGVVSIEGPKWCGKTWTSRAHCNSEFQMTENNILAMDIDPQIALQGNKPHLIDEWQVRSKLWDMLRFEVDKTGKKGQYVICGSSTPNRSGVRHSGAGRFGSMKMQTMSLFETGNSDGSVSLKNLFNGSFTNSKKMKEISLDELIKYTIRGGWPGLLNSHANASESNKEYLERLCEEDVINIDGTKRNAHKMMMFIRSIARNTSTVVSDSTLAKDMEETDGEHIGESTIADYKSILERLHVIQYQPAFSINTRSSVRVGKNPKKHLVDPSLAMAALNLNEEKAKNDLNTFGFIFESLCIHDLGIYAEADGGKLYHYRDDSGNEIDAIVEMPNGQWGAFEVKLGFKQVDAAAHSLLKINEMMERKFDRQPSVLCVICGTASMAYRRPDGVFVVPITMLRN